MHIAIRSHLLKIFSVCLLLTACTNGLESSHEASESPQSLLRLGMNDLSILFPVFEVKGLAEALPRIFDQPAPQTYAQGKDASPLDGHGFVMEALGQELKDEAFGRFSDLRLVALRWDPCANALQVKLGQGPCLRQLRLTWQALQMNEGRAWGVLDSGIHAIYQLSEEDFKAAVAELIHLHDQASLETRALPLQVHPVIAREGLQSPYLAGVLGLVHRYARASKLMQIAFMRRQIDRFPTWEMGLFQVENAQLHRLNIPFTKAPALVQRLRANSPVLEVEPRGQTHLSLEVPFVVPGTPASPQDNERLNKPFESALAIENPHVANAFSIDCASCHRSTALYQARKAAEADGRFAVRGKGYESEVWNLTPQVTSDPSSLHMFSYFGNQAEITPRVVNETAEALTLIP